MKNIFKKHKGFTLLELLVSMAIVVLLSTIILFAFGGENAKKQLDYDSRIMAEKIAEAKILSLTNQSVNNVFPECYGISIDELTGEYLLYGRIGLNGYVYDEADGDFIIESIDLSSKNVFAASSIKTVCFKLDERDEFVCDKDDCVHGNNLEIRINNNSNLDKNRVLRISSITGLVEIDSIEQSVN